MSIVLWWTDFRHIQASVVSAAVIIPLKELVRHHTQRARRGSKNPVHSFQELLELHLEFRAWCEQHRVPVFRSFNHLRWMPASTEPRLILSITGSGKTNFARRNPWVIDGECLMYIYRVMLHERQEEEWALQDRAREINAILVACMQLHLRELSI